MTNIKEILMAIGRKQKKYELIIRLAILSVAILMLLIDTSDIVSAITCALLYIVMLLFCSAKKVASYSEEVINKNKLINILLSDEAIVDTIGLIIWVIIICILRPIVWYLGLILIIGVSVFYLMGTTFIAKYFEKKIVK